MFRRGGEEIKKVLSAALVLIMLTALASPVSFAKQPGQSYEWLMTMSFKLIERISDRLLMGQNMDEKYAVFKSDGTPVSGFVYDYIHRVSASEEYFVAVSDGESVILDKNGEPAGFKTRNYVMSYGDDAAVVLDFAGDVFSPETYSGKMYVYSYDGTLICELNYSDYKNPDKGKDFTLSYFGGLCAYRDAHTNLCGAIDTLGDVKIAPQYTSLYPFDGGYAIAEKDGKFGIIDTSGKTMVNFTYDKIEKAYTADEQITRSNINKVQTVYYIYEGKKCGLMSTKDFSVLMEPTDANIHEVFLDEKRVTFKVPLEGYGQIMDVAEYGLMDFDGNIIVPADNLYIGNYSEGGFKIEKETGKGGIINAEGEVIIPLEYDRVSGFSDGLCYVHKTRWENGLGENVFSGFIDKTGATVLRLDDRTYCWNEGFNGGLCAIKARRHVICLHRQIWECRNEQLQ